MTEAIVHADKLLVIRGPHRAIDGISFDIQRGGIVGILGPSGCGKSTLMRCIVGVQRTTSGTIDVLGVPAGSAALRRRVGYTTQAASIYSDLTVRENLRYFARILGVDRERVDLVINMVDLASHADAVVGRLSGGQLTRASLAVALLANAELLVLDEPTVGLDPVLRRDLWTQFRGLAAAGVTLIVSSHVMDEAQHCDSLILLRQGRIVAIDTVDGLRHRTGKDSVEEAFIDLVGGQAAAS